MPDRQAIIRQALSGDNLDELLQIIGLIDDQTRALVLTALQSRLTTQSKRQATEGIRQVIQRERDKISDWVITSTATAYNTGANTMLDDINTIGISPTRGDQVYQRQFTTDRLRNLNVLSTHREAVNALASENFLDFATGLDGIVKAGTRQLSEGLRRQIQAQQVAGRITGVDVRRIGTEIADTIGQQGFSALIYRNGAKWTLPNYSKMLARTQSIKAFNEGTIARVRDWGIDLVQVSRHPHACDICTPFETKIYSVSGNSDLYPPLNLRPPFHPNCGHSLLPYVV